MDDGSARPTTTGTNAFGCGAESVGLATRPSRSWPIGWCLRRLTACVADSRLVRASPPGFPLSKPPRTAKIRRARPIHPLSADGHTVACSAGPEADGRGGRTAERVPTTPLRPFMGFRLTLSPTRGSACERCLAGDYPPNVAKWRAIRACTVLVSRGPNTPLRREGRSGPTRREGAWVRAEVAGVVCATAHSYGRAS